MGDDFCVRLALEPVTLLQKLLFQRQIVFDDAIVDHCNVVCTAGVWMGIIIGDSAVGGPACMANTYRTFHSSKVERAIHLVNLPNTFSNRNLVSGQGGNPYAVIASVFHPLQALNQRGCYAILA